ncbi:MAG: hypothetical protein Kow002_00860 [Anaerolineales bacterium]
MSQDSISKKKPKSALQIELDNTKTQLRRLVNCWVNTIFNLSAKGSRRRGGILSFLFFAIGFVVVLKGQPMFEWIAHLSSFFRFLLNPDFALQFPTAFNDFFLFVGEALFRPEALRYLPVIILPYLIGLHAAALYLDDLFDLKQIDVAKTFIRQVALTGGRKKIRFAKGELVSKDYKSQIYLIGGPGQVVVELDTAVLFEKPDGRPHVIGPNSKNKMLDGFERFRGFKDYQAIDLRDQYSDPVEVDARSLDGIPVSATDVRMVFSVHRDGKPTPKVPHPFNEEAIKTLIYGQASRVLTSGTHASEPPESWVGTMKGLIRSSLASFMSKHRLSEYLASIGPVETDAAEKREKDILDAKKSIVADGDASEEAKTFSPPPFLPRREVNRLFDKIIDEFKEKKFQKIAHKNGVDLHWIGVGTWKTPEEVAPAQHLEAWKLSRENAVRGNDEAIKKFKQEAQIQRTIRDIQDVPLARFSHSVKMEKHKDAVKDLLIAYREQLIEAVELLRKSDRPVPNEIFQAIRHLEIVAEIPHWVGRAGSRYGGDASEHPSNGGGAGLGSTNKAAGIPSTQPEPEEVDKLWQILVKLCNGDEELAEQHIRAERKKYPHSDRKTLIERAIARLTREKN